MESWIGHGDTWSPRTSRIKFFRWVVPRRKRKFRLHFYDKFPDRSQYIQKSSEALAGASQLQIGRFWADSVIKISLFENSLKCCIEIFLLTKNQLVIPAPIPAPIPRSEYWMNRWRWKALRVYPAETWLTVYRRRPVFGPRHNFWSLISRLLEICKFVWSSLMTRKAFLVSDKSL